MLQKEGTEGSISSSHRTRKSSGSFPLSALFLVAAFLCTSAGHLLWQDFQFASPNLGLAWLWFATVLIWAPVLGHLTAPVL